MGTEYAWHEAMKARAGRRNMEPLSLEAGLTMKAAHVRSRLYPASEPQSRRGWRQPELSCRARILFLVFVFRILLPPTQIEQLFERLQKQELDDQHIFISWMRFGDDSGSSTWNWHLPCGLCWLVTMLCPLYWTGLAWQVGPFLPIVVMCVEENYK